MKNYVATYQGAEEFGEFDDINPTMLEHDKERLCRKLIDRLNLLTNRKNPKTVKVDIYLLRIVKGEIIRNKAGSYDINLPYYAMTSTEYEEEMRDLLKDIPEEFRSFVDNYAYERGHSGGYEEVINIVQGIVSDLKPCIEKFTEKFKKKIK